MFSWSYRHLGTAAARTFRLLGLHPGPDISLPAVASLAGIAAPLARQALGELTRAYLLDEHVPARYRFHDLLRAYAAEQAAALDDDDERRAAVHRMLDHYLQSADAADRALMPYRDRITVAAPRSGVTPEANATYQDAMAWCDTERPVLLATIAQAADTGFDTHAWQLAWTLVTFFLRRGHWHDNVAALHIALAATRRLGDRPNRGRAHFNLASAYERLGSFQDAEIHNRHALDLFQELADPIGQAQVHLGLAWLFEHQGQWREALGHALQALDSYRSRGHLAGQARALNRVGWECAQLGDHHRALEYCEQALTRHRELGDRYGAADTWDSPGYVNHQLGRHADTIGCYQEALGSFRELGDGYSQAVVLDHIGDAHHAADDPAAAREAWQQAARILTDLRHPGTERVQVKLAALDSIRT